MKTIETEIKRLFSRKDFTIGSFSIDGEAMFFSLEDEKRTRKIAGETRIPEGRYELKLRKVLSPMTKRYRARYGWFKWHIEITGIPNFKYVYIHIGNTDDDTDACPLIGYSANLLKKDGFIGNSALAYKAFYDIIFKHLNSGGKSFITVK